MEFASPHENCILTRHEPCIDANRRGALPGQNLLQQGAGKIKLADAVTLALVKADWIWRVHPQDVVIQRGAGLDSHHPGVCELAGPGAPAATAENKEGRMQCGLFL